LTLLVSLSVAGLPHGAQVVLDPAIKLANGAAQRFAKPGQAVFDMRRNRLQLPPRNEAQILQFAQRGCQPPRSIVSSPAMSRSPAAKTATAGTLT
jgi:hypothetical protein